MYYEDRQIDNSKLSLMWMWLSLYGSLWWAATCLGICPKHSTQNSKSARTETASIKRNARLHGTENTTIANSNKKANLCLIKYGFGCNIKGLTRPTYSFCALGLLIYCSVRKWHSFFGFSVWQIQKCEALLCSCWCAHKDVDLAVEFELSQRGATGASISAVP